jgi:hypothetical protein
MYRPWFAIVSAAVFLLVLDISNLRAQCRSCDKQSTSNGPCDSGCERVGVCIPSLQFLVLDRLSAAGDRWEQSMSGGSNRTGGKVCRSGCTGGPGCDHRVGRDAPAVVAKTPSAKGVISDSVPPAPFQPLPPVPHLPVAVNNDPVAPSEPTPPKLLPTPVSEQVTAPNLSDRPKVLTDIPEMGTDLPECGSLPVLETPKSLQESPLPALPEQPLPDILVDPFIEDVGERKIETLNDIALAAAQSPVPKDSVILKGPKRLAPGLQGIIARQLDSPKSTRIIFKRVYDERLVP